MFPMKRVLLGIVLVVGLTLLGFAATASLAATYWVPRNQGLAGGAIVLGYGVLGALACLVLGIVLAWRLAIRRLVASAIVALALSFVAVGGMVWKASQRRAERMQERGPTERKIAPDPTTLPKKL